MNPTNCPKLVAIIEDDIAIREAIADILRDEGYEVLLADHGRDALDQLSRLDGTPCVIILDLMMPVMDGWAFRAEQTKDPKMSSIPVIVLTADARAKDKAEALGANAHMGKPVDVDSLLETVEQYC